MKFKDISEAPGDQRAGDPNAGIVRGAGGKFAKVINPVINFQKNEAQKVKPEMMLLITEAETCVEAELET